ncbi:MAG: hypothetical protein MUC60_00385 [Oscillatoria sp. Prado101]|nr:hypothetical protein [Oscillatoria sp. Prado101]
MRNPLEHICSIATGTQASEGEAAGVSLSRGQRQTVYWADSITQVATYQ